MHGPDIGRTKCTITQQGKRRNIRDFTLQEMKDSCVLYNDQVILTLQEVVEKTRDMFKRYFVDVKIHVPEETHLIAQMLETLVDL